MEEEKATKPRKASLRRTKAAEIEELKKRIFELECQCLTIQGQAKSDSINMESSKMKSAAELKEAKNLLEMERRRSECLAFAFGEFRCRELLWFASQWMRNSNFDIRVNGEQVSRTALLGEIDQFLKSMTFKRK